MTPVNPLSDEVNALFEERAREVLEGDPSIPEPRGILNATKVEQENRAQAFIDAAREKVRQAHMEKAKERDRIEQHSAHLASQSKNKPISRAGNALKQQRAAEKRARRAGRG